jgi:Signal transduction histidine kinase regulating C4-dicarboxylate transport system
MKIKLFLVTIILTALLYVATNYFFVNYTRSNLIESAKNAVSQSVSVYSRISEADKFDKIHKVESIAKNAKLIEALDPAKWEEVSEEVLSDFAQYALEREGKAKNDAKRSELSPNAKAFVDRIETEMNVINQIYDYSNTIFVADTKGNVIAKNLDGIFKGVNLANEKLFQAALRGTTNRDIIKIKGKTYLVSAAPIIDKGDIIGIYFSADNVDSEAAKNAVANLYDESIFGNQQSKFYFGFFDKSSLLGSTLPTQLHESFKKFIKGNQDLIAKIDEEDTKRHDMEIILNGETFFASVSRHPSLSDNEGLFYLALVSKDKLLEPLSAKRGTFTIVAIFLLVISLVLLYIFDEQNGRPVNKFMEGMLEIINGNIKFRFNNDAKGVEGNLNQNANMMIATILGERMPDKEKPVSIKK